MSRFHKIFLASALVVVGYGVAKFLGQPVSLSQVLPSASMQTPAVPLAASRADATANGLITAGRVRLLPDPPLLHADILTAASPPAIPEPPALGSLLGPVVTSNTVSAFPETPRSADFPPAGFPPAGLPPIVASTSGERFAPSARLRDEAPRPVGVDPQSPVSIRRMPRVGDGVVERENVASDQTAAMSWPAPPLMNAGNSDLHTNQPPIAVAASYSAPASDTAVSAVSPPPWPMVEEMPEARSHTIIDGDTLEKLATRYLHDVHRSGEIYALNRDLLSSPDLLPIGAEVKIPQRIATRVMDQAGWQPNSASTQANRDTARENSTVAHPASSPQEIIPRAQLANPVMVQ